MSSQLNREQITKMHREILDLFDDENGNTRYNYCLPTETILGSLNYTAREIAKVLDQLVDQADLFRIWKEVAGSTKVRGYEIVSPKDRADLATSNRKAKTRKSTSAPERSTAARPIAHLIGILEMATTSHVPCFLTATEIDNLIDHSPTKFYDLMEHANSRILRAYATERGLLMTKLPRSKPGAGAPPKWHTFYELRRHLKEKHRDLLADKELTIPAL